MFDVMERCERDVKDVENMRNAQLPASARYIILYVRRCM